MPYVILDEKLASGGTVVLDGAIGSEIQRLGGAMHGAAWCGVANRTHPDIVRRVHETYLEAGADIATANTFTTCRHVLAAADLADEAAAITREAVALAKDAVERAAPDRPVAVAGSMSNMLAWQPGTLSTDLRYAPDAEQEAADYRELANALAEAGADVLLLEMMLDTKRASRLAAAAASTGLPVWIGISCSLTSGGRLTAWNHQVEEPPEHLAKGEPTYTPEPLEDVIDTMLQFEPQVVGLMHSTVPAIEPGLKVLAERWSGPVMTYPEATNQNVIAPPELAAHCRRWVDDGVRIVGGCCGTTVEHIRAVVAAIRS